jgi:hypothetical protein
LIVMNRCHDLGVPLDAHDPGVLGRLDRLEDAVLGPPDLAQGGRDAVECLMVMRVHPGLGGAQALREEAVFLQLYSMDGLDPGPIAVVRKAVGDVCEVLFERATQVDVQELHPPADREERQVAFDGYVRQRHLKAVAEWVDVGGSRVRLLPEQGGVDVSAARQHQPGGPVEERSIVRVDRGSDGQALRGLFLGVELVGAQDLGDPAGRQHGVDVVNGDPADVAGVIAPLEG